jgi:hypothetical protein
LLIFRELHDDDDDDDNDEDGGKIQSMIVGPFSYLFFLPHTNNTHIAVLRYKICKKRKLKK